MAKCRTALVFLVSSRGRQRLLVFWKCLPLFPEPWSSILLLSWVELLVIFFGKSFSYLIPIHLPNTNWVEFGVAWTVLRQGILKILLSSFSTLQSFYLIVLVYICHVFFFLTSFPPFFFDRKIWSYQFTILKLMSGKDTFLNDWNIKIFKRHCYNRQNILKKWKKYLCSFYFMNKTLRHDITPPCFHPQ